MDIWERGIFTLRRIEQFLNAVFRKNTCSISGSLGRTNACRSRNCFIYFNTYHNDRKLKLSLQLQKGFFTKNREMKKNLGHVQNFLNYPIIKMEGQAPGRMEQRIISFIASTVSKYRDHLQEISHFLSKRCITFKKLIHFHPGKGLSSLLAKKLIILSHFRRQIR